jgi:2,3-bisphosphoglycerate-dependent phosphoglycerate mutase
MPTRIILARHGETDWNRERRWQGHSDRPLNDTGREQAETLAAQLADEPIAAVYSSDLVRAHETARIVAERLGLDVVAVPGLRERRFGSWEGLHDVEVERRFPGIHSPPDGEAREEMARRVLESWTRSRPVTAARRCSSCPTAARSGRLCGTTRTPPATRPSATARSWTWK